MKLVEVARKYLLPSRYQAWYLRRVEMIEPEEVARRLNLSVHRVHSYVWEAERELTDHFDDIDDPDDYLVFRISILRGHRVENALDSTPKAAIEHEERLSFVNNRGRRLTTGD